MALGPMGFIRVLVILARSGLVVLAGNIPEARTADRGQEQLTLSRRLLRESLLNRVDPVHPVLIGVQVNCDLMRETAGRARPDEQLKLIVVTVLIAGYHVHGYFSFPEPGKNEKPGKP
jgi:hypothetical protein